MNLRIDGTIDLGSVWNYSYNVRDLDKVGSSPDDRDTRVLHATDLRDDLDNSDKRDTVQRHREDYQDNSDNVQWNIGGKLKKQEVDQWDKQNKWNSHHNVQQYKEDNQDNSDNAQWNIEAKVDKHIKWNNYDNVQQHRENNQDNRDNAQFHFGSKLDKHDNIQRYKLEDNRDNHDIVQSNTGIDTHDKVLKGKEGKHRIQMGSVGFTRFKATTTTLQKVKDVERTKEFTSHVYMQTMKVFDAIKKKLSDKNIQSKVDQLARSYKEEFANFVQHQRETSVKTDLGEQRAILHTMETSNLMLQRLINFLKADLGKNGETGGANDNTLQKEVDTVKELEYKHVCTKYGYCRSDKGLITMLQNCVRILINVDDEKMYQARDAITEVVKTSDLHKIIDSKSDKTLKKKVSRLEKKEPVDIRESLRVLLGILSNFHSPLVDEGENRGVVKRTAALYQLMELWEEAMPADESNKLEWDDIERSLGDWSAGKRTDVFEIVQALGSNLRKGLRKIDPDAAVKMKEQVRIISG